MVILLAVALAVAFFAWSGFHVAQEYERAVVFRLGRISSVKGPGVYWNIPLVERQRLLDSVKTGDGWRVNPNPIPADTSAADVAWISKLRMPQSAKCFEQPLQLQGELTLPRAFIHCTRYADKKPFAQFASRVTGAAGWQTHDLDASHSPNITAPVALMDVLQRILPA